ncbi:MAG TPA: DUF1579 family protein [Thermoanaerobaculia bacterium]|nr:DUF1579 family protein [Thermoanaerobaculia bacterium]
MLDNLTGKWALTREIRGKTVENAVDAEWMFNHQFLRIHMKDVATPPTYEVMVFIGYDNTSERYVAHWLDIYGGRFSETLGYGRRSGNSITFTFEYPDGPFHNKFVWDPSDKHWQFRMEGKDAAGNWKPFATDTLRKAAP